MVLRVAQEALHNALRHSGAGRISLELAGLPQDGGPFAGGARLRVSDDGKGFDPQTAGRGLGLASMRERADSVGGRLTVHSEEGRGTVIELEVPRGRA